MKSLLPITLVLISLIITVGFVIASIIPIFVFKYHLAIRFRIEYEYNTLSYVKTLFPKLRYSSSYTIYQILSERETNNFESFKPYLEKALSLLLLSDRFKLIASNDVLIEKGDCAGCRSVEFYIVKPYGGKLIEKITLVG